LGEIKGVGEKTLAKLESKVLPLVNELLSGLPLSTPATDAALLLPPKTRRQRSKSSSSSSSSSSPLSSSSSFSSQLERISKSDLNAEQIQIAERALDGRNVFITGSAGTGKSFLLKYIIQELQSQHGLVGVAVTASTGIAAVNLGGQTVHNFAGIGLGKGEPERIVSKVLHNEKAIDRWVDVKVLVIDEISMVDRTLFELLDLIARRVRNDDRPFGGIQLILVGDFLQLPPVPSSREDGFVREMCFESPLWEVAKLTLEHDGVKSLNQIVRQSDAEFAQLLNEARLGTPSEKLMNLLRQCHVSVKPRPTDGIIPTKLYCINKDVDRENLERLGELPGEARAFEAVDSWKHLPSSGVAAVKKVLAEMADKVVPRNVDLKIGTQVMLTRNRPGSSSVMNGSRGIVVAFAESASNPDFLVPRVRFDNGQVLMIAPVEYSFKTPSGEATLVRLQLPLKLAWALTVHKSQGTTLTRAELELSNAFDFGQAYVALSRVTSLEGLWLTQHVKPSNIRANPRVLAFLSKVL
jgi:ATP-dependent DNA helicase PIF1